MTKTATSEELSDLATGLKGWPGGMEALEALVAKGCDRDYLLELLVKIRRASGKALHSKEELQDAAKALREAGVKLNALAMWDQARYLDLNDDAERLFRDMSRTLLELAPQIKARAQTASKRKPVYLSRNKARIVEHVLAVTGEPFDGPVALLIAVAATSVYDAESHRKWRGRIHKLKLL